MTQSLIGLRTTPHGGRSLFPIQPIAEGTSIFTCEAPFAHVIYKDYRREVCAQCFAYAASTFRSIGDPRTWSIRSCRVTAETVWFCTDECKVTWESGVIGPLIADINALLGKAKIATRRNSPKDGHDPILPNGPPVQITQDYIDKAWADVEELVSSRARLSSYCSTMNLEDMELEISRSVASAIVQRYVSDHSLASLATSSIISTLDPWTEVLDLQSSELSNVILRPYILAAHLRVYAFLCHSLPKHLRLYVPTARHILARDTGNAFGIWDGDHRDEMLGWGLWVGASYFNHSKNPLLRKPSSYPTRRLMKVAARMSKRHASDAPYTSPPLAQSKSARSSALAISIPVKPLRSADRILKIAGFSNAGASVANQKNLRPDGASPH